MFIGVVNKIYKIKGKNLTSILRQASKQANKEFNIVDTLSVQVDTNNQSLTHFSRINKKYPNNKIIRGEWC